MPDLTHEQLLVLLDTSCATVARLQSDLDRLQDDNRRLHDENRRLQVEIQQIKVQLDQSRRAGKRQAAPFRKGPPKPQPQKPGRKAGPAHGQHGHRPEPPPEQIDEVHIAALPDDCPHCHGHLVNTETVCQYQTEIPRQPLVRRFDIHVGQCHQCGRRVQGRHPLQTSNALGAAASQIGPDAQAAIVTLNKEAGLSHGKVAQVFDHLFGITISRGASAQIMLRAADRLEPAYEEIRSELRVSDVLTVDETGWRVGGGAAWLHAWVTPRATCYEITRGRSADALERVLGLNWAGVLIHDGYSSYDRFTEAVHQGCLAHILRRAHDLREDAVGNAGCFPRQVMGLFRGALHLRNEYVRGRLDESVWEGARDDFEDWLLRILLRPRGVPEQATLSRHLLRYFSSWLTFLTDPAIGATNCQGEQAIRPAVVNRKVWGGNRTWRGGRAQGILSSVIRTCHQSVRSGVDYISETLRAFGNRSLARPILFPP